jgi:hypothetical protein
MRKTIILALAVALVGGMAYANFGALDNVPAATLLVPYIVVDTDFYGVPDPAGYTTLTVVTNVSSIKQIIHVTVWAADSSPVIDFDEVLSGYDVWSINWRDMVNGNFGAFDTGAKGGFWLNDVSDLGNPTPWGPDVNIYLNHVPNMPVGDDTDFNYPLTTKACGFPWGDQTGFAGQIQQELAAPLVAWPNQDTDCDPLTSATGYTDGAEIHGWHGWLGSLTKHPLFFYATIDSVFGCNRLFPGDLAYWTTGSDPNGLSRWGGPGHSYLTEWNTLTGMDLYLNSTANYSESLPTVNIEATRFYNDIGFYSEDLYAATNHNIPESDREPLPTAWAFYYFQAPIATTEVVVWKNYDDFEVGAHYANVLACLPYVYYAFDDNENFKSSSSQNCPSGTFCLTPEPNVFPFQTQKVPVTPANFDGLPSGDGWMLLVFDPSVFDGSDPQELDFYLQTYLFVKYNYGSSPGYSTAVEGTVMANWWWNDSQFLPFLNTYDGSTNICPAEVGIHTDFVCVAGINVSAAH